MAAQKQKIDLMDLSKKLEELKQLHSKIARFDDYNQHEELLEDAKKTVDAILDAEDMIDLLKKDPESQEVILCVSVRKNLEIELQRLEEDMQKTHRISLN